MIATVSEIKTLTGLADSYDAQIEALIPMVQNYIVDYTGNRFEMYANGEARFNKLTGAFLEEAEASNVVFDSTNKTITAPTSLDYSKYGIAIGKDISVRGSRYNDGLYTVEAVNTNVITVSESLNGESLTNLVTVYLVNFPQSLKFIASQIIKHWLLSKSTSGVQSERLGDYSINYSGDLPAVIIKQLNNYRQVKFV